MVGKEHFQELSMGGDQNEYALQLLKEAAKDGKWLCLKNLHLVINFVSILEKEVLSMEPHDNFRLFLTT
jgi:dynein heavy chain 2